LPKSFHRSTATNFLLFFAALRLKVVVVLFTSPSRAVTRSDFHNFTFHASDAMFVSGKRNFHSLNCARLKKVMIRSWGKKNLQKDPAVQKIKSIPDVFLLFARQTCLISMNGRELIA
jgi:hypothetical protein